MSRSNAQRSAETRTALLESARERFAADGYAATSTTAILDTTGLTRGALYHHFRDKADLFEAVIVRLHEEAVTAIGAAAVGDSALEQLVNGCMAWMAFMRVPEHRRLLIVEAPPVLGWERWQAIDTAHGFQALREGVSAAVEEGFGRGVPADALAVFLNGAMNQLVLRDDSASLAEDFRTMLFALR